VKFSVAGDIGTGNIKLAQTANADREEDTVSVEIQVQKNMGITLKKIIRGPKKFLASAPKFLNPALIIFTI